MGLLQNDDNRLSSEVNNEGIIKFKNYDHMNRFEIAQAKQQMSLINYLRLLLHNRALMNGDKGRFLTAKIKEMIWNIKNFLRISLFAKMLSVFIKRKDVENVPVRYEDTQDCKQNMKVLDTILDIDDRYIEHDVAEKYAALTTIYDRKHLKNIKLTNEGYFDLGDGNAFQIMDKNAVNNYVMFINELHKKYPDMPEPNIEFISNKQKTHFVVPVDNDYFREYSRVLIGIKEQAFDNYLTEDQKQAMMAITKDIPQSQINAETIAELASKHKDMNVVHDKDKMYEMLDVHAGENKISKDKQLLYQKYVQDVAVEEPAKLANMKAKFKIKDSDILDEYLTPTKNGTMVPKGYVVKLGAVQEIPGHASKAANLNKELKDAYVFLPIKGTTREGNEHVFNVNLNFTPYLLEKGKDGQFHNIKDGDKPKTVKMSDVIQTVNMQELTVESPSITLSQPVNVNGIEYKGAVDNNFNYVFDDKHAMITKYIGDNKYVDIPKSINIAGVEYPVDTICSGAFEQADISKVKIHSSITDIQEKAFVNCPITSIKIPESVSNLSVGAFDSCNKLKNVTIVNPDEFTPVGNPFVNCPAIDNFVLEGPGKMSVSNGLLIADDAVISYANGQKEHDIIIPENIKTIGEKALSCCGNIETISGGKNVDYIGFRAFSGCSKLKSLDFADNTNVINISDEAFNGDRLLRSFTCMDFNGSSSIFDGCGIKEENIKREAKLNNTPAIESEFNYTEPLTENISPEVQLNAEVQAEPRQETDVKPIKSLQKSIDSSIDL